MVETRICTPERLRRSGVAGASAAGVGEFGVAKGRALWFLMDVISSETRGTILNPPVGIFISHSSLVIAGILTWAKEADRRYVAKSGTRRDAEYRGGGVALSEDVKHVKRRENVSKICRRQARH